MDNSRLAELLKWGACRGRGEDEDLRSLLLCYLLCAMLGSIILLALVNAARYYFYAQRQDAIYFGWDLVAIIFLIGATLLNRQGYPLLAAGGFVILSWLSISFLFPVDMNDHTKVMLAAPIVISSFVLWPRCSFVMAGLSVLSYTIRFFYDPSGYRYSVLGVLYFFLLALISYLIADQLQKAKASSRAMQYELHLSQANLQAMVENTDGMLWTTDREYRLIIANQNFHRYAQKILHTKFSTGDSILVDQNYDSGPFQMEWKDYYDRSLRGEAWLLEAKTRTIQPENYVEYYFNPIVAGDGEVTGVRVLGRDITYRKQTEERLKNALAEKDVLLREVYHRTKNNLQVVSSLLELQASSIQNEQAVLALHELTEKIHSMALVHEKLYQSQTLSRIDLKAYIADLMELIQQGYLGLSERIQVILDTESVLVPLGDAVPCGIILTELAINSLKHAFPGDRKGEIRITLRYRSDGQVILRVADNGVGVPPGFDFERQKSLGLQTVRSLVERQLGAKVTFSNGGGVVCEIVCQLGEHPPEKK